MKKCTLALGCFWKPEEDFKSLSGIIKTEVGYAGGINPKVTYKEVCGGNTGHAEVSLVKNPQISTNGIVHIGIKMDMQEGWHTYWVNPGDSGGAIDVKWILPINDQDWECMNYTHTGKPVLLCFSMGKYAKGSTRYLYTNCKYSLGFTNLTKVI